MSFSADQLRWSEIKKLSILIIDSFFFCQSTNDKSVFSENDNKIYCIYECKALAKLADTAAKHYCLSPKSAKTLLSLTNDTETNKSVWQAMFASFAKA